MQLETSIYLAIGDSDGSELPCIVNYDVIPATHEGSGRPVPEEHSVTSLMLYSGDDKDMVDVYSVLKNKREIMDDIIKEIKTNETEKEDDFYSPSM